MVEVYGAISKTSPGSISVKDTHMFLGCLLWSDWVKAWSLTFLRSSAVEIRRISASLSRIKGGVLRSVPARLTEVLEPRLPQDKRGQYWGRSPLVQIMLSFTIISCGNKGLLGSVASWQSPHRASCTTCAAGRWMLNQFLKLNMALKLSTKDLKVPFDFSMAGNFIAASARYDLIFEGILIFKMAESWSWIES